MFTSNKINSDKQFSFQLYKFCWVFWILIGFTDIVTTYIGIRTYGCRESNDFLLSVIGVANPLNHFVFLFFIIITGFRITEFLRRKLLQKTNSTENRNLINYVALTVPLGLSLVFLPIVIKNILCIINHT